MPKVDPDHLAARRARILDGARRAFARWGYHEATLVRLEAETGLSRGAIFHYFADKEDLFCTLAREVDQRYRTLIGTGGVAAAIRAVTEEDPDWLAVLVETQSRLRHDPDLGRRLQITPADRRQVLEWFERGQRDGTLRRDVSSLDLARFATTLFNGVILRIVDGLDTDVESMILLLDGVMSPREPR